MSLEFKLREWCMNDLPSMAKHANNPKIENNLSDGFPHPYTVEDGKKFLKMFMEDSSQLILCIDVNGEAAGSIGIHPRKDIYHKNAEIGYWLGEPFWEQGIISRAVPQMVTLGFKTFDIERIYAPVFGRNKASQRVLQKCGFEIEGEFKDTVFKNGQFEDEVVLAIRRTQWEKK